MITLVAEIGNQTISFQAICFCYVCQKIGTVNIKKLVLKTFF